MNCKRAWWKLTPLAILVPMLWGWGAQSGTGWIGINRSGGASNQNSAPGVLAQALETYSLDFSTYIGGAQEDYARDVALDPQGNIYVVGGTASVDFPTTLPPGFNNGGCPTLGSAGQMDAFVMKFNPHGQLLWSRLLGGPCYDRAYAVEVDPQGSVFIGGRAGVGFPTTSGSLQPSFQGGVHAIYGEQNAFVVKLNPNGSVSWASYVGVGPQARDLAVDRNGDVYIPLTRFNPFGLPPAGWFANAYQKSPAGGTEAGAVKIKGDGSQVLWATWLGGTGNDTTEASIRVDNVGQVYLALSTDSQDIPTTPGTDRSYNGGKNDYYVAKLSADGSNLLFGTYLGGSGNDLINTHNLALDGQGNIYVTVWTDSSDFPTTSGSLQTTYRGGISDIALSRLSATGALLNSTYLGGRAADNPDGLYVDANGNLFIVGQSNSPDFPITQGASQPGKGGQADAVLIRISSDLSQLIHSTFFGGRSDDNGRTGFFGSDGSLILGGTADGPGWPVKNPFQAGYSGGPQDAVLARFTLSGSGQPPPPPSSGTPVPPGENNQHNYLPFTIRRISGSAGERIVIPQTGGAAACSKLLAH